MASAQPPRLDAAPARGERSCAAVHGRYTADIRLSTMNQSDRQRRARARRPTIGMAALAIIDGTRSGRSGPRMLGAAAPATGRRCEDGATPLKTTPAQASENLPSLVRQIWDGRIDRRAFMRRAAALGIAPAVAATVFTTYRARPAAAARAS